MRSDSHYQRMRDTIRRSDTELQGFLNPMVSDHGDTSEARQYAGSAVPGQLDPRRSRPRRTSLQENRSRMTRARTTTPVPALRRAGEPRPYPPSTAW